MTMVALPESRLHTDFTNLAEQEKAEIAEKIQHVRKTQAEPVPEKSWILESWEKSHVISARVQSRTTSTWIPTPSMLFKRRRFTDIEGKVQAILQQARHGPDTVIERV